MKTMHRKQATHRKSRVSHAARPHVRRARAGKPAAAAASRPTENGPESQTVGDEYKLQSEARVEDDSDAEAGICGLKRGETAG
jgi:hypothetical protein